MVLLKCAYNTYTIIFLFYFLFWGGGKDKMYKNVIPHKNDQIS